MESSGDGSLSITFVLIANIVLLFFLFIMVSFWARRYIKTAPDELLIVYGRKHTDPVTGKEKGYRLIRGGGAFIFPVIESYVIFPLDIMSINIEGLQIYNKFNRQISVDITAHIRYINTYEALNKMVEQLFKTSREEILKLPRQILESKIREAFEIISLEDINSIKRNELIIGIKESSMVELENVGMELSLFNIKKIKI